MQGQVLRHRPVDLHTCTRRSRLGLTFTRDGSFRRAAHETMKNSRCLDPGEGKGAVSVLQKKVNATNKHPYTRKLKRFFLSTSKNLNDSSKTLS